MFIKKFLEQAQNRSVVFGPQTLLCGTPSYDLCWHLICIGLHFQASHDSQQSVCDVFLLTLSSETSMSMSERLRGRFFAQEKSFHQALDS